MALALSIDGTQQRLKTGHISLSAIGEQFKGATLTNVWIDPVTYTVQREPDQFTSSFYASDAGVYQKLRKADFTFTTSSNWIDRYDGFCAGAAISSVDSSLTSEKAVSTASYVKNRGWFIAWFAYGAGSDFVQFQCGWNPTGTADTSTGVALVIWSSGFVEVWKNGVYVGDGKITGGTATSATAGQWVSIAVLPHRGRDLLVVGNQGDGFAHTFVDLDPNWDSGGDLEIIPAGKFWWASPSGGSSVVLAPLTYPSTGSLVTEYGEFAQGYDAHGGAAFAEWTGWQPASSDTVAISVTNVSGSRATLRIDFSSGSSTRATQVFGIVGGKAAVSQYTDASEELDLSPYFLGGSLEVGEDASSVRFSATVKNADGVNALAPQWRTMLSRPCQLKEGSNTWLDGVMDELSWQDSPNPELVFATVAIRDRWRQLEKCVFRSEYPLDKLEFSDAIVKILQLAGCGDLVGSEIETTALYLPGDTSPDGNKWSLLIRQGDTAADWIKRLMNDFAAPYFWGIIPTASGPTFALRSPTVIDEQTPDAVLYRTDAEAVAGGISAASVWANGYWSLQVRTMDPEANEVWVTGWDRRTDRAIQAYYRDADLQDATLPPSSRPEGWAGEPRLYGLVDSAMGTSDQVEQSCAFLAQVLTVPRTYYEFTANALTKPDGSPVWRGDKVTLKSVDGVDVDVIITALSVDVRFEADTPVRPTRYTACSKLGRPTFGRGLDEIAEDIRARGRIQVEVRRDSEFLRSKPASRVTVLA
ncbi:MAG: hypothetical protein ACOYOL_07140 [Chthoniobacterales bacterium]